MWNKCNAANVRPVQIDALTQTAVSVGVASTSILAASSDSNRRLIIIQNRGTTAVYLSLDATAATTGDLELLAGESLFLDTVVPQQQIFAIRASGTANVLVISG